MGWTHHVWTILCDTDDITNLTMVTLCQHKHKHTRANQELAGRLFDTMFYIKLKHKFMVVKLKPFDFSCTFQPFHIIVFDISFNQLTTVLMFSISIFAYLVTNTFVFALSEHWRIGLTFQRFGFHSTFVVVVVVDWTMPQKSCFAAYFFSSPLLWIFKHRRKKFLRHFWHYVNFLE